MQVRFNVYIYMSGRKQRFDDDADDHRVGSSHCRGCSSKDDDDAADDIEFAAEVVVVSAIASAGVLLLGGTSVAKKASCMSKSDAAVSLVRCLRRLDDNGRETLDEDAVAGFVASPGGFAAVFPRLFAVGLVLVSVRVDINDPPIRVANSAVEISAAARLGCDLCAMFGTPSNCCECGTVGND